MRKIAIVLSLAVTSAGSLALLGCETDDSLPTRPRTVNPFPGNEKAQENAEKRALEDPGRQVPMGGAGDAPRQLNMTPSVEDRQVALLDDQVAPARGPLPPSDVPTPTSPTAVPAEQTASPAPALTPTPAPAPAAAAPDSGWGNYHGAVSTYPGGIYPYTLPELPANPGTVPMSGSTPVPNTPWVVEHSWGEVLQLQDYPHRAWPESQTSYMVADVKHNPVYYFNVGDVFEPAHSTGSGVSDWTSNAFEIPWFYGQTVALPVLMILEPPLAQRTTDRSGKDPNYHGYLPSGPTVVSPTTGVLQWEYPFMNPDGSIKEKSAWGVPTTAPASAPLTVPATTMP